MSRLSLTMKNASKLSDGNKLFRIVCLTLTLFCLISAGVVAQKKSADADERRPLAPESATSESEQKLPPFYSPKKPVNCEVGGRYIDNAISRAARIEGTYLVAIIRPGTGESSLRLNEMRLLQIKAYFEYTRFSNYVVATGEGVRGYGRIELFVGGKLLYTLPLHKNRGMNLLSCVAV